MRDLLLGPFDAAYMQRALVEAVLLGIFGGVLGVYVVLRHLAFISDALTHTVFPGVAVAFVLDASLYLGAFVAGALSAVLLTVLTRNRRVNDDAALTVLLTTFFSVGVVVVSRSESFSADLTALLFGRILSVSVADIAWTVAAMVVVLVVLAALHKELVLRAFAPDSARAMGYRTQVLDLTLNLLITLFVVAAVKAVGTVLVVALVITPAATGQLWGRSIRSIMAISVAVGVVAGWLGLAISYRASVDHDLRLASGATIVLVITTVFVGALAARKVVDVARARRPAVVAPPAVEGDRRVSWLTEPFGSELMQRALLEAVLTGALCGAVGVHVVLRRLSFFTMALTHATFPGLVLAALVGVSLFFGTAAFGVVVVLLVVALSRRRGLDPSTATGVVLAGGFALGVVLISTQEGFTRDLSAFLVGSILTVEPSDLLVTAGATLAVAALLVGLHKELVLAAFDPAAFEALGYRVVVLDIVLLIAIEITVVTSIPAMGTILAVALIVAPASAARLWTDRVGTAMALAAVLGAACGVAGLWISHRFDLAAGASISLVAAAVFALAWVTSPGSGVPTRARLGRGNRVEVSR